MTSGGEVTAHLNGSPREEVPRALSVCNLPSGGDESALRIYDGVSGMRKPGTDLLMLEKMLRCNNWKCCSAAIYSGDAIVTSVCGTGRSKNTLNENDESSIRPLVVIRHNASIPLRLRRLAKFYLPEV